MTKEGQHRDFSKLIQACVKGKSSAQKKLYDYFSAKMFSVCLRYMKDQHEAEDVLQEGFIKVFKNLEKFRSEGAFEGWVRRIFVNTAIERIRKGKRLYPVEEFYPEQIGKVNNDALSQLSVDDIMAFVGKLSPGYRTIFNLYAIEGFSHKEIAENLGISEGTSKSQLARARYLLQEMVTKHMEASYEQVV